MQGCYDVIVLGAGISGLAAARLSSQAGPKVLVLEQYAGAGGNHITETIDGMEFDIGSIYFHASDSHFALFPELKEACVPARVWLKKVNWFGRLSPYPLSFQIDILANGLSYVAKRLLSLAIARIHQGSVRSAADLLRHKLGPFFFETSGLSHYMQRLTGLPPHQTARSFVDWRMR